MPVKKNNGNGIKDSKPLVNTENCNCTGKFNCGDFCKKFFVTLFGILLVYIIVFVAVLIKNEIKEFSYIGQADRMERTITIDGDAKITATPDIAVTTMGMLAEADTVAEAQAENSEVMNALNLRLKKLGISEEDIQTSNYNIYPRYDYTDDGRVLRGYEVSQNVTVKIRDLDKANQVVALAGEVGINSVSGLSFTIDDTDVYKEEARQEALKKVWEKADALAKNLGVRIVNVVSYNEFGNGMDNYAPYKYDYAVGLGGGAEAPNLEPGSMEINMNVSVTFEIR